MAFVVVATKRRRRKGCNFLVVWVVIDAWPRCLRTARLNMDDVVGYDYWPYGGGDVGDDYAHSR